MTVAFNSPTLTRAESIIFGYLVSVGGSDIAGSTIKEIMDATKLSQQTVYTKTPHIPGVQRCRNNSNTGAAMYYIDPIELKNIMSTPMLSEVDVHIHIMDSIEWSEVAPHVRDGLESTVKRKPASFARIGEIAAQMNQTQNMSDKDRAATWAIGGQAIAIIALELLKEA